MIPVIEVPLLLVSVILLVPLISLLLVVPTFSVVLLVQVIFLHVSKVHSVMCQWPGSVMASLRFGAGCGEMWYGITRVHILLVKHIKHMYIIQS